jgi:flagellar biosynthesis/type III secretory pathway ATPase
MTSSQKRAKIKHILSKLDNSQQLVFLRMYTNGKLDTDIDDVVDQLPLEKLDWALQQCKNTYHKIFQILKDSVQ